MSLYDTPDTVPSRVVGIIKTILSCSESACKREDLIEWIAPPTLRGDRTWPPGRMASDVIGECVKMGLLREHSSGDDAMLSLSETTQSAFPKCRYSQGDLRRLMVSTLADIDNDRNHNYCRTVYWFLCQDPYSTVVSKNTLLNLILEQSGQDSLGVNNERWGAFQDWSTFLGFGWSCPAGANGESIVPDPTAYLRLEMGAIFSDAGDETLAIAALLAEAARRCPMLPGGLFGDYFKNWRLPSLEDNAVPKSIALALLRLHETACIELIRQADAPGITFMDGSGRSVYTHIVWKGDNH